MTQQRSPHEPGTPLPSARQPRESAAKRSEQAYAELKDRILQNAFPVGAFVLEQELADLLKMSRTPIREALVRLANEGLVELRPRHGMRVLPISTKDMREIYAILTALEAEVVAEIARRGLQPQEREALTAASNDMEAALADDDLEAWAAADARWHRSLVETSTNRRLRNVVLLFWDQAHRVRMMTLHFRGRPVRSTQGHVEVMEAIEAGDPQRAARIHRTHREEAAALLADILTKMGGNNL